LERSRIDGVQASRPLGPHPCETAFPEHPQVEGNRRLGDAELASDHGTQRTGGLFVIRKQLEDPPTDRLAENIEAVHNRII
jgi:hypothetical protein